MTDPDTDTEYVAAVQLLLADMTLERLTYILAKAVGNRVLVVGAADLLWLVASKLGEINTLALDVEANLKNPPLGTLACGMLVDQLKGIRGRTSTIMTLLQHPRKMP